jgi:5-methylthioadenosine/S-adenosylhomocysteine deaminase
MDSKPVLIRDGALLTSTGWVNPGYVVLKDGLISEIGHGVPPQSWQDVCEIFSVSGHAVLPGFVNGHTHFSQTFMRGLAGGRPLLPWLKQLIWPLQGVMSAEELKLASLLGLVENLRSGVTEVVDHHKVTRTEAHTDAVIAAARVVGLRLKLARSWNDLGTNAEARDSILQDLRLLFTKLKGDERIQAANGPLALWRCSEDLLRETHLIARENGSFTHFHVAETQDELKMSLDLTGLRPVQWLARIGVLDEDTQVVHAVWVDDAEIDLLVSHSALVVSCPVSNAVMGSGAAPLKQMLAKGARVRLGTDGPASNDTQDMLETVKAAINIARTVNLDPTVLPPAQALRLAIDGRVLAVGDRADVITINLNHPRAVPVQDQDSAVVMCSHGSDVRDVFIAGDCLLRGGLVQVLDESSLLQECAKAIVSLRGRAGLA